MTKKIIIISLLVLVLSTIGYALTKQERILLTKQFYEFEPNSVEFLIAQLSSTILELEAERQELCSQKIDLNNDGTVDMQDFARFTAIYSRCLEINQGISERINRLKSIQVNLTLDN